MELILLVLLPFLGAVVVPFLGRLDEGPRRAEPSCHRPERCFFCSTNA